MKKENKKEIEFKANKKLIRQVKLFYAFMYQTKMRPKYLMTLADIKCRRTFERDLIDFRDSGLFNAVYNRKSRQLKLYHCDFNKSVSGYRRKKLERLYRICTIFNSAITVDAGEYYSELELIKDCKENNEEYIPDYNIDSNICELYEELFPGTSKRTRQRDFRIINCAGKFESSRNLKRVDFKIIYDRTFKKYLLLTDLGDLYASDIFEIHFDDKKNAPS